MAAGVKYKINTLGETFDLRQNTALGADVAATVRRRYGAIDYEYGIKSASTDFVSDSIYGQTSRTLWSAGCPIPRHRKRRMPRRPTSRAGAPARRVLRPTSTESRRSNAVKTRRPARRRRTHSQQPTQPLHRVLTRRLVRCRPCLRTRSAQCLAHRRAAKRVAHAESRDLRSWRQCVLGLEVPTRNPCGRASRARRQLRTAVSASMMAQVQQDRRPVP